MGKIAMIISGIILILGCLTLGFSLLLSSVLPCVLQAYLVASVPPSWSSDMLHPNITSLYVLSVIEIVVGIAGMFSFGIIKTRR